MVLFIPINAFTNEKKRQFLGQKLKFQDSRMKMMNEILNGIKVFISFFYDDPNCSL